MSILQRRKLLQGDNHCYDCFIACLFVCLLMGRGSFGRLFCSLCFSQIISKDALSQVLCKTGETKMHHNHLKWLLFYLSCTTGTVRDWLI